LPYGRASGQASCAAEIKVGAIAAGDAPPDKKGGGMAKRVIMYTTTW
jgi:hypothetical protein